jgi:hypothetical protein
MLRANQVEVEMRHHPQPIKPGRLRRIEPPFGWIPFQIVSSGLLRQLSTEGKLLYFVLCVVADRQGLSFWSEQRLAELLCLPRGELKRARLELCEWDLLAFNGWLYQLLSFPVIEDYPLPVLRSTLPAQESTNVEPTSSGHPQTLQQILERLRRKYGDGS